MDTVQLFLSDSLEAFHLIQFFSCCKTA